MDATRVQSRKEVVERLQQLDDELDGLGVERLGLFGSFHRDEADAESDVDLLVEFRSGAKSFDALYELSMLLERRLGRSVELVTPESLSYAMRISILDDIEYVQGSDDISSAYSRRT